jgi:hypothetical protein
MTTPSADERQTDWSVLPVALAFGFGMGAAGWWLTKEEPVEAPGAVMTRVESVQPPAAGRAPLPVSTEVSPPVRLAAAAMAASAVAGPVGAPALSGTDHQLDAEFGPPVLPPLKVRPPFMNANEWTRLTEAVRQAEQTDEEAAALVNHLRFRRLLKRWHDAPPGVPGGNQLRAKAAQALLDDLRSRLQAGHLGLAEARQLLPDLLADAVASPGERVQRAQALADELNQAAQVSTAANGAPAPELSPDPAR